MDALDAAVALAAILGARYVFPGHVGYAFVCLALMVALPVAAIKLRGGRLGDYLLQVGDARRGLKLSAAALALSLPFMLYGAGRADFQAYYPGWGPASESLGGFIMFESYIFVIMVCTEVFYRGFLMNSLLKSTRYGNEVHALIYAAAHLGKPPLEVAYSLPVGWIFGQADRRCGSILPSLAMHFVSSVAFDALILWQKGVRLF